VAVLNLKPSAAWHKAALTAAARAADAGRCSLKQLSTLVWSVALLRGASSSAPLLMSQQLQVLVLLQAIAAAQQGQGLRVLGPGGCARVWRCWLARGTHAGHATLRKPGWVSAAVADALCPSCSQCRRPQQPGLGAGVPWTHT
jgi:hypothetical protein